jgi:hypothetical protein
MFKRILLTAVLALMIAVPASAMDTWYDQDQFGVNVLATGIKLDPIKFKEQTGRKGHDLTVFKFEGLSIDVLGVQAICQTQSGNSYNYDGYYYYGNYGYHSQNQNFDNKISVKSGGLKIEMKQSGYQYGYSQTHNGYYY